MWHEVNNYEVETLERNVSSHILLLQFQISYCFFENQEIQS